MAAAITVQPRTINFDVGKVQTLTVTNTGTLSYTMTPEGVASYDLTTNQVTALKEGTCKLEIKATDSTDNTETYARINITVVQYSTKVVLSPNITTMDIGKKEYVKVDTDASDFKFECSDTSKLTVTRQTGTNTLELRALSAGTAIVTVKATKQYYKETTAQLTIEVAQEKGVPVKIKLHNKNTGRITTIQTNNNESTEDVVYKLPEASGTLITQEAIDSLIKVVQQPKIVTPLNNATNVEANIVANAFQAILGFQGTHTATEWEIATDENFSNIIKYKKAIGERGHNLTEINPCIPLTQLWVRVKYWSGDNSSAWSEPVTFTTGLAGPAGPQTLKSGNATTAGYFGEVTYAECIPDTARREYMGNWETLSKIAETYTHKSKITAANRNTYGWCRGDYLVNAPENAQVHYKDKVYYAKKLLQCTDGTFTTQPGTDETCWVEDTRGTLDTPKTFLLRAGLGYNARPNKLNGNIGMSNATYWHRDAYPHADKPTTLPNYIYPWGMASGGAATVVPASYDVPTCSWLKFAYKGKILYTPKVPLLASIAWNDLAKVHAVYGDRTMRIGTRLYYYRLLKEEEYKTLLIGLTDGTLGNLDSSELDIDEATVVSSKNVFRNSVKACWIEDFTEGANRKTITGSKDNVAVSSTSCRSACGVYRPVLELIPEGEEPYNNLPDMPVCYDENFQYDKYTDTGYFGRIKAVDFIDGTTLANNVGLTAGTAYLPNYDWMKFYYHGAIVFLPMSPLRHTVSWVNLNDKNILYGCDLGGRGRTDVKIGKYTYSVEATHNVRGTPRWNDNTWQDHNLGRTNSTSEDRMIKSLRGRVSMFSMVQELMTRVCGNKILNRDFMYSTDELAASGTNGNLWCDYPNLLDDYSTNQIGDNWAEFSLSDMCVRYCDGFSGTAWHGKYLYACTGTDFSASAWADSRLVSDNSPHPWHFGLGYVYCGHVPAHVDAHWGFRCALHLRS